MKHTNTKELFSILIKYEYYIQKGNKLLIKHFDIKKSPLLAKRAGTIPNSGLIRTHEENMTFRFHGMGCRFEFNDIVVEFDYAFKDFAYEGFDVSKLFWFVESYSQSTSELRNKSIFEQTILKLVEERQIIPKKLSSIDTYDYIFKNESL